MIKIRMVSGIQLQGAPVILYGRLVLPEAVKTDGQIERQFSTVRRQFVGVEVRLLRIGPAGMFCVVIAQSEMQGGRILLFIE